MAIEIDRTAATTILSDSFTRCSAKLENDCLIRETIDFVLSGKNCLTFRYVLFAALLAKATDGRVDILSLQAGDKSSGAYDARSLASKVIYPFQLSFLGNVLDGSNNDPLVNKPARFERLSTQNHVAAGDPRKALEALCCDLPKITSSADALSALDYLMSRLIVLQRQMAARETALRSRMDNSDFFATRKLLSDLLDQGFGGTALTIVATVLLELQFKVESGFSIRPHPVNQSGKSKRQFSDLDVLKNGKPFLGIELKDRSFTEIDVSRAATTALAAGAMSLLFIAGRRSNFAIQPPTYFYKARDDYAKRGLNIGLASIDSIFDATLAFHAGFHVPVFLDSLKKVAVSIGAIEAQMWVYKKLLNDNG